MNIENVFNNILIAFQVDDYNKVISIWEEFQTSNNTINLSDIDLEIIEAIALSYYEIEKNEESLKYLSLVYERILKSFPSSNNELNEKFTFITDIKLDLLRRLNQPKEEYKSLLKYVETGGDDQTLHDYLEVLEKVIIRKFYLPVERIIVFLVILISILDLVFKVKLSGTAFIIYLTFGLFVAFSFFFTKSYNKLIRSIIRSVAKVF